MTFADRTEAGRKLAHALAHHRGEDAVVLGLPRGGVPVAFEVARALSLPLDVLIVRKIGAPGQPELGLGAIAEGGAIFLDTELIAEVGASQREVDSIVEAQRVEIARRARTYRMGPPLALAGRTAIVVDDGIATGGTVRAALRALDAHSPRRVVLGIPVASVDTLRRLRSEVDELVCVEAVPALWSVGENYDDFTQTTDDDVIRLLHAARMPVEPEEAEAAEVAEERAAAGVEGGADGPTSARS